MQLLPAPHQRVLLLCTLVPLMLIDLHARLHPRPRMLVESTCRAGLNCSIASAMYHMNVKAA